MPSETLLHAIIAKRWTREAFKEVFSASALNNFWSWWTRLVKKPDETLEIINTSNAWCPLTTDAKPLLTIDIWEHAYYLQYQNRRAEYIEKRWTIVNREFVATCHSDD
jgi:Fe-Mn family superoxide dismutase